MLRTRGILLEVCLILVASRVRCQNFEYAESGEDRSEYSEDGEKHQHPDYTKYYSVQGSAPVAATANGNAAATTGFTNPSEFASYFSSPIVFGESNKKEVTKPQTFFAPAAADDDATDPLAAFKKQYPQFYGSPSNEDPVSKDYFEESQKLRALEKQYSSAHKPDPYYISDSVPTKSFYDNGDKAEASKDDVETITPKLNKNSDNYDDDKEGAADEQEIYKFRTLGEEPAPVKNDKQYIDYNIGKSSSTVSQYPYTSGLASTTLSPYQKYSFRPVSTNISPKYIEDLVSTVAPFNPNLKKVVTEANEETQPSETSPEKLKGCTKLLKPATDNHDAMNCFVCEDLAHNSKYTQCSYAAEPSTPVHFYAGSSERYSVPAKAPDGFRYKRHARRETDPYELIKQRSRQYYDEFERDHAAEETERQKDFKYVPYSYDDEETGYSESQSEEFKKNPDLCKKVEKDGMTCTVCKNEKTGGNFEQCSYTVAPNEQKYAYVAEKKYDSDDPQGENNGETGETRENPQSTADSSEKPESKESATSEETSTEVGSESREDDKYAGYHYDANKPNKDDPTSKLVENVPYIVPGHFAESVKTEKKSDDESDEKDDYHSYHYKIFPDFAKEESKKEEEKYPPEGSKHDVEEVLAEFAKKDRSNCKKAEKNGMVCYLCIDKNKVKHEECMYVADSKPKASHIAYHEVQKYREPKPDILTSAEATQLLTSTQLPVLPLIPTVLPAESKRKHFFKKVEPSAIEPVAAASEEVGVYTVVKKVNPKTKRRLIKKREPQTSASEKDEKEATEEHAEPETPEEFKVSQYEGAFSAETKPVYSKIYGSHLPKYMVDKTEFEKEFDAFSVAFH